MLALKNFGRRALLVALATAVSMTTSTLTFADTNEEGEAKAAQLGKIVAPAKITAQAKIAEPAKAVPATPLTPAVRVADRGERRGRDWNPDAMFDRVDSDGDGNVSREEFHAAMKRRMEMGKEWRAKHAERIEKAKAHRAEIAKRLQAAKTVPALKLQPAQKCKDGKCELAKAKCKDGKCKLAKAKECCGSKACAAKKCDKAKKCCGSKACAAKKCDKAKACAKKACDAKKRHHAHHRGHHGPHRGHHAHRGPHHGRPPHGIHGRSHGPRTVTLGRANITPGSIGTINAKVVNIHYHFNGPAKGKGGHHGFHKSKAKACAKAKKCGKSKCGKSKCDKAKKCGKSKCSKAKKCCGSKACAAKKCGKSKCDKAKKCCGSKACKSKCSKCTKAKKCKLCEKGEQAALETPAAAGLVVAGDTAVETVAYEIVTEAEAVLATATEVVDIEVADEAAE